MNEPDCWPEWFDGLARGLSGVGFKPRPDRVLDAEPIGAHPMDHGDVIEPPLWDTSGGWD